MLNSGFRGKRATDGTGAISAQTQSVQATDPVPKITGYAVTDSSYVAFDDTAATSGAIIVVYGNNFVSGMTVYINNSLVSATYLDSTRITFIAPTLSNGTYIIYMTTPQGNAAILSPGIVYSGFPTWTTSNYNASTTTINIQLLASGDAPLTYSLQGGSTLPTGITLTSTGVLTGTATSVTTNSVFYFTVIVEDTQLQGTQQSITLTFQFGDSYFKNTTLLLNGETTVTPFISDASTNSFGLTIQGDTKPVLFNPYTPGYYSNYFDGTGDYLQAPSNAAFQFGTADFTIEAWVYMSSGTSGTIFDNRTSVSSVHPVLYFTSATAISYYVAGGNRIPSGSYTFLNKWVHVAVCRASGSTKLFFDGVQTGSTYTDTNDFSTSGTPAIGASYNSGASNILTGYISNLRIVKGTAVYTTAFTPSTTPLTAIENTSLLTCQSNRLIDNSTNNFTITKAGDVSVSSAIPFTANSSYSTYGSAYFDGTGDYLSIPTDSALELGSGDYTIEGWWYFTNTSNQALVSKYNASGGYVVQYQSNNLRMVLNTGGAGQDVVYSFSWTPVASVWYHIAITRSGTNGRAFINGVQIGTTTTFTTSNAGTSTPLQIGSTQTVTELTRGYVSNLRIVKGTAVYTANFTPSTTPLTAIANTSLLTCQYNGGATNQAIIDNSNFNNIVTRFGNTSQGTFSPYSVTGWSNYFDGTGDYLSVSTGTIAIGTGDLTLECWGYRTSTTTLQSLVNINAYNTGILIRWETTKVTIYVGGTDYSYNTPTDIPLNSWVHIALVRSGGVFKFYVNGTQATTFNSSYSLSVTSVTIGTSSHDTSDEFYGYISNVRLVNSAIYTTTFTPSTTPLTAVTNTSLLTCQSNRFIDNSPNSFTLTRVGDVSVQAFGPFGSVPEAVPISYSNYFDGTGDYINAGSGTPLDLSGDFTVEYWVYGSASDWNGGDAQGYTNILDIRNQSNATEANRFVLGVQNTGSYPHFYNSGPPTLTLSSIPVNVRVWNHIAYSRSGSTIKIFVNGVEGVSFTDSTSFSTSRWVIGMGASQAGGSNNRGGLQGYISNFRVVKGTAVYTANFTPPTSPLTAIANTSLLTCQSTTMIDNSSNYFAITAVGDTKPRIFNPFGYTAQTTTSYTPSLHGGSIYLDGTLDNLYSSTISKYGSTNHTIECWVFFNNVSGRQSILNSGWNTGSFATDGGWTLDIAGTNAGGINFALGTMASGSFWIGSGTGVGSFTVGQWYHIAIVRNSTTVTIYSNGVSIATGTLTASTTVMSNMGVLRIGAYDGDGFPFNGYISDVRVSSGALYTSNFVSPTVPLTPTVTIGANTFTAGILVNGATGGIIDQHGTNVLETVGNAQLSTSIKKYNNASMYFDGTGDYLTTPAKDSLSFGTGDFTVEAWVYFVSIAADRAILGSSGVGGYDFVWRTSNGLNIGRINTGFDNTFSFTPAAGQWYHIAYSRSGTSLRAFVDGTQVGTTATNSIAYNSVTAVIIGGSTTVDRLMNGYIDDLRITKGFARYTANFTAPTIAFLGQ